MLAALARCCMCCPPTLSLRRAWHTCLPAPPPTDAFKGMDQQTKQIFRHRKNHLTI